MWKSISQVLADQFGAYYFIKTKQKIHTGETNETWLINDGIQPVFVKINDRSYRSMFRAEAEQLERLYQTKTVNVPKVYGVGISQSHSFLLLEALPIQKTSNQNMGIFGQQLAKLHLLDGSEKYGLDFDTWLGSIYQPNDWKNNWSTFFSEYRIGWQLQLCYEKGIDFGNIELIIQTVTKKLNKHQPKPSLVHGNLWTENCALVNNQIFTYDPAIYWGDRECDLAFTELFEPFSKEFYENYNSIYPVDKNFNERKKIYQLYYLLNFSHRFPNHYINLTKTFIDDLLK
ncbi:fructosamine-3-kinase [Bisgaardia hudsonensis]|uniref:Fructosamine-3-kinase n=1 Tax=Bisgaardia hudsonensis TaxID=109472 RepID=A0A4R2N1I3_9PAST|nr:fructosamine kinase family protein [Bisgaardia hudsonensis]QLB13027.1 hypothetical protein A6A11_05090 [Bisgaardia hudsonensis]TCP13409.1 fructosamine-3-kinase [Bisgaardia hudsonensis]